MATATVLMTAEEFSQLPDTRHYELVRGELIEMVRPTVWHAVVCGNVVFECKRWARPIAAGTVVANDAGIVTERDPDSVRGPDCIFIRADRVPADLADRKWLEIPPDLAVEVLSLGDR